MGLPVVQMDTRYKHFSVTMSWLCFLIPYVRLIDILENMNIYGCFCFASVLIIVDKLELGEWGQRNCFLKQFRCRLMTFNFLTYTQNETSDSV